VYAVKRQAIIQNAETGFSAVRTRKRTPVKTDNIFKIELITMLSGPFSSAETIGGKLFRLITGKLGL
jgi:hypothetical protein